jgi:hypothetical protein
VVNKSRLALITALALASVASPALSRTATTVHHRRIQVPDRSPIYNYVPDQPVYNYIPPAKVDPSDDPALTGGGSPGYNACTGHARC